VQPDDPVIVLKGIGPKTSDVMAAEGVRTVADLLLHLPRRYEDRSHLTTLDSSLEPGMRVLVRGRVRNVRVRRIPRRRLHIVDGLLEDGFGKLKVVWFNQRWLGKRLEDEPELILYGPIREARGGGLELLNPELEEAGEEAEGVVPIYPKLARFGGRRLRNLIAQCVPALERCRDPLSEEMRRRAHLPDFQRSLLFIASWPLTSCSPSPASWLPLERNGERRKRRV
jgi:ATP-dependent DNA helicase RecG